MTNEEALASVLAKILVAGDPLVIRNIPGLAFEQWFVTLDTDELLAVVKVVNHLRSLPKEVVDSLGTVLEEGLKET